MYLTVIMQDSGAGRGVQSTIYYTLRLNSVAEIRIHLNLT